MFSSFETVDLLVKVYVFHLLFMLLVVMIVYMRNQFGTVNI